MSDDIDSQMLSTLELLHYCQRFRDRLFAFSFERSEFCEELLIDLRILHAAGIRQVLFCATDASLLKKLELWNRSGYRFSIIEAGCSDLKTAAFIGELQRELGEGNVPFVALENFPRDEASQLEAQRNVMHCAVALGARKVFFPGPVAALEINQRVRSYPSEAEIQAALEGKESANVSPQRLQFIAEQQQLHLVDMVIVAAQRGAIYREVFTHAGSGTLFTRAYPNILRPAGEKDVRDIMAIMQPYVEEGSIKPVSEEALLASIRSFTVYSVNDQIVAAATLIQYGDCYELGKLCTLPRYQARGRARDLVRALLERAQEEGKAGVFALTVQDYVGDFFVRMGFQLVAREALPEAWQQGYDFSRPSQAYFYSTSGARP